MYKNLITACCVLAAATSLVAAELIGSAESGWPQWRGSLRDGVSNETGLLQSWPEGGPKLLWQAEGLGKGWSCPIVHRGTIYITGDDGENLVITALGTDGEKKWETANGEAWHRSYPGARAACTIASGTLYHVNAHGRVAALNPADGKEQWSVNMLERFGAKNVTWAISENLLIDGERVIVTPAGDKALVAALNRKTGETIWATDPIDGEKAGYASPILVKDGDKRLLIGYTNPHAWVVDADTGKLQWKSSLKTRWGAAVATPVFGAGGVAIQAPDGPGTTMFTLAGEKRWHAELDTLTGSGVYRDGVLYANGCKASKTLHALDMKTGAVKYDLPRFSDLKKPNHASSALIWADNRLYGLFEDGHAALLNPKSDGFEVVGKMRLVEPKRHDVWAHPVLLDGRLYLRYHGTLYCYDVKR
jgi:outer membrane protein assembly factor BamB